MKQIQIEQESAETLIADLEKLRGTRVLPLLFFGEVGIDHNVIFDTYEKCQRDFKGYAKLDAALHLACGGH